MDVASHFLDSGAFSLRPQAIAHAKQTGKRWGFYSTPDFWEYMKKYVRFNKKYRIAIDLYANVDVIGNPALTWRNQKWLERQGLNPVPVVHFGTDPDLKWLRRYVDKGYPLIGLGGLVGKMRSPECLRWLDQCFEYICDNPERLPRVKVHGFGVARYTLIVKYPWWSVDSTTWLKVGGFGGIIVPHKRKGQFVFDITPYIIGVSVDARKLQKSRHYQTLRPPEQRIVHEWLRLIDVPLGARHAKDGVEEDIGVRNNRFLRCKANLLFFEKLRESLPEWPWPFRCKGKKKRVLV